MNASKLAYFLSKYRALPENELIEVAQQMTERAEEAAQALTLALSERKLVLPVLTPVQYPPSRIDSDQVAPESPPSDRTWMLGYAVIAAGLILPTLAKLSSTFDPINVILFYVVGVAVWGSVAAAAIVIWKKFKSNKTKIGHMSEAQIKFTCPTCSQIFSFGPQQYDGKHIIKY